ncbi:FMN-dependent NADH-azoreductase [Alphaproteobacteria bacterium GH1-50]|uniref:FMN dependent NADH:quinone oxidoreductase n=1 Tax=Kangsaoukella pontilimi TaxID=2691042 RepID=A0A7C9IS62_9RHOB|nr:NAD(P)H-dependent oxidoreductase [Kangsaoukella pontilimi]MXQ09463.1 FMN-dependent NADH-azoreductase [Kangsaoukella pontilimi]
MTLNILRIDASVRREGSVSRELNDKVIDRFAAAGDVAVTKRDLITPLPLIDETWIGATFTDPEDRTDEQTRALELSDDLIAELQAADTLVIGLPIYNFAIPSGLKAWIDLVSRRGVTFRYTESGPVGLLTGKRAIVTVASGGTEVGSDIDFATGYLRHALAFIGITDVLFVKADRLAIDAEATLKAAEAAVAELPLAA